MLPDSKSSMLISLLSTRKWSVPGGFLLDIIFSTLRCPSQDVAKLDGMVGKVERISHMDNPIHQLVEQQMSLPDPDENASMNERIQIAIMHKSWDPRSITMPTFHLQPSKVTVAMVFSKEARAVGGMVLCTLSGQEHVQRGGRLCWLHARLRRRLHQLLLPRHIGRLGRHRPRLLLPRFSQPRLQLPPRFRASQGPSSAMGSG